MNNTNDKKDNIVVQASLLAVAGIVSRIIGLLYRGPLNKVIGELGLGYYQSAFAYYTIVLLISSYSIPSAISKVIAQKLAVREYRNAHRIFKCALVYVLIVGGIGSAFLFFGAGLFVDEQAVPVLRVFAPTILVYGVLGVLRGYFQAHRSMLQTSISQILEQIVNAVVSIGAAYLMIKITIGTMEMPTDAAGSTQRAIYGAMGSAMGTGMGVLFAMLFMLWVYWLNHGVINKRIASDRRHKEESYVDIFKTITMVVTPFILSTAVYNMSSSVNTKIFTSFYPDYRNLDHTANMTTWGIFSGQSLTISNIPIAFASAMASAMIPSVATLVAADDIEEAKNKIALAVKTTMIISIPCAVGMFTLAEPITSLIFFGDKPEVLAIAGKTLMALSLSIIFYALSTLNSSILQGIGKVNTPIVNAGIALAVQTVLSLGLLMFTDLDIYSIAIANTVYSGIMCILNQSAVRRAIGYRQEYMRTFVSPALAAAVMGIVVWLVYQGLFIIIKSSKICVIPAIIVGGAVYFVALIMFKGLTEEELKKIPKGGIILRLAKKFHLM